MSGRRRHGDEGALHAAASRDDLARASRWLAATYRRPARPGEIEDLLLGLVAEFERTQPHARGHAERVAALSLRIAVRVGLGAEDAAMISRAARLHDVGKAAALRAAVAEVDETSAASRHALLGAHLVVPFEFLAPAAPMIRHHHERVDGSGQPDGLFGLDIPVGARIIAVADAYDHLTAGAWPTALSHRAALAQLAREAGRTFDATVISALCERPLP
jgi:response regulator RpfG family c-di-GMP phosphodiesterase